MLPLDLATRLKDAGLRWKPAPGDHFAVPDRDLDDEVFVLSNMVIEVHQLPEGAVIAFNGTTEWAMDDLEQDEAIWLPREDQLRALLGRSFRSLVRVGAGFRVEIQISDEPSAYDGDEPSAAYAQALLALVLRGTT